MYHELGHDVFNFNHGNGGKMMYNYIDKDINWKDFMSDRINLFGKNVAKNLGNLLFKDQSDSKKKSDEYTSQVGNLLGQLYIEVVNSYKEKEFYKVVELEKRISVIYEKIDFEMKYESPNEQRILFILGASLWMKGDKIKGCEYLKKYISKKTYGDLVTLAKKLVKECD